MPLLSESLQKYVNEDRICTGIPYLDTELGILHYESVHKKRAQPIEPGQVESSQYSQVSQSSSFQSSQSTQDSFSSQISPELTPKNSTMDGYPKGVPQHSITEISGLPGVGKTSMWLSLILNTLSKGNSVCFVSCNHSMFPLDRARQAPEWKSKRFEKKVQCYSITKIEELLVLKSRFSSGTATVVLDHYDNLIDPEWSREVKSAAAEVIITEISEIARSFCVIMTSGCIPYNTMGNEVILAPAFRLDPKKQPRNMVRLMILKDKEGNSMLSSGPAFAINSLGQLDPIADYDRFCDSPVPLSILSRKKRRVITRQVLRSESPNTSSPRARTPLDRGSHKRAFTSLITPPTKRVFSPTSLCPLSLSELGKSGSTMTLLEKRDSPNPKVHAPVHTNPANRTKIQPPEIQPDHGLTKNDACGQTSEAQNIPTAARNPSITDFLLSSEGEFVPNSQLESDDPFMIVSD